MPDVARALLDFATARPDLVALVAFAAMLAKITACF